MAALDFSYGRLSSGYKKSASKKQGNFSGKFVYMKISSYIHMSKLLT